MSSELTYRATQRPLVAAGGMECHAADMVATISAEMTLGDAQSRLAEVGQWLPMDGAGSATIGRLVEENSTGPLRLGYGAWRDLLTGVQFYNGRGELITAGGRTVKNVAGYDLTKFVVGQRGVLARVATITVRTYRRPAGAVLARFAPSERTLREMLVTECRPQWAVLTSEALLCGYLGDEATVELYAGAVKGAERRTVEEDIRHREELWRGTGFQPVSSGDRLEACPTFRAAVPPMRVMEFAMGAGVEGWVADAAFGIVIGQCESQRREAVERAAKAVGGSVVFFSADGAMLDWPGDAVERRVLEQLKKQFDPEGRLAPLPWKS